MSHFAIACGGTGGHLAPGVALAEILLERGHTCKLVISRKEIDSRLIQRYPHLEAVRLPGRGFGWKLVNLIRFFVDLAHGVLLSLRFIRAERPDFVVAFGGFLSVPVVLAARWTGTPVALHEANARPGKVVRRLRNFADRIYLPPSVSLKNVAPGKVMRPGYPVRKDIVHALKADTRERLGIRVHRKLLVVLGGSQGAEALNKWIEEDFERLAAQGISVYCVTGPGKERAPQKTLQSRDGDSIDCYFVPFSDDMGAVLSAADLVVSRAGAGSIAEIIRCRVPSILIPFPYAADDHQESNARYLERCGGCVVIKQNRLHELSNEVEELVFNDWLLQRFKRNLARIDDVDAGEVIVRDLEKLILSKRTSESFEQENALP